MAVNRALGRRLPNDLSHRSVDWDKDVSECKFRCGASDCIREGRSWGECHCLFCVDGHVCIRRRDPGRSVRRGVVPEFICCLVPVSGYIATIAPITARLIMACCHQEQELRAGMQDNVWRLGKCPRTCRTRWGKPKISDTPDFPGHEAPQTPDLQSLMMHILPFKQNRAKFMWPDPGIA